ncbi:MAG TPA: response regulator [Verrucomicrobiae bacterium]|nr:response regulator [Verrucomicrobiae bacterium]
MSAKILSVDDSKVIRLMVMRALRPYDCQIFEAGNGQEGLAMAEREKPDLIIADLTMPVMTGVEMLNAMRTKPGLQNVPVIILTAEPARDTLASLARLGVRDYLNKPLKDELIVERVGRIVKLQPKAGAAAPAFAPPSVSAPARAGAPPAG